MRCNVAKFLLQMLQTFSIVAQHLFCFLQRLSQTGQFLTTTLAQVFLVLDRLLLAGYIGTQPVKLPLHQIVLFTGLG